MYFLREFWGKYPALFWGLNILLGFYASLSWNWSLLVPFIALLLPFFKSFRRLFISALIIFLAFTYVKKHYEFPTLPPDGIVGQAHFKIDSIQKTKSFFGRSFLYRGTVKSFVTNDNKTIAKNIPCSIYLPQKPGRPNGNYYYIIQGTLKKGKSNYLLKPDKKKEWTTTKKSWSLVEKRFQIKQALKNKIYKKYKKSGKFLASIATGEFSDPLMFFNFNRLGLQHIMAISGFHFAIIAAFLSMLLSIFLSPKKTAFILIITLFCYFLFIGGAVSIKRAWIAVTIALVGQLIEREPKALNTLGIAIILVTICNPIISLNLGFKFSFLVTGSILLLYAPIEFFLGKIIKRKSLQDLLEISKSKQHLHILLSVAKGLLALTIAVHLVTIPIVLYTFHKFPLLSLVYNLFFPFLVSISMILLLLGLSCGLTCIHSFNDFYTSTILSLTSEIPNTLNFVIRTPPIPEHLIIVYITALLMFGIVMHRQNETIQPLKGWI